MIRTVNLCKTYEMGKTPVQALQGVTLHIPRGDFVAVTGPSGSGKSTFMNLIGCLDTASSGTYFLDGIEVGALSMVQLAPIRAQKIGFVFQRFHLLDNMTALENVELPLLYLGKSPQERRKAALLALSRVGLSHRSEHLPCHLSGGQQQRVAIARALVADAPLLLADEPTGNLDSNAGKEILRILCQLNELGTTIVLITHDDSVARLARHRVVIRDGRLLAPIV